MTREIHDIPPSPRRVRHASVMWHWWPVALGALMFGVYGGLLTLMLFLARGGKQADDLKIDADSRVVTGKVTRVEGGAHSGSGLEPIRISYDYVTHRGNTRMGRSFLHRPDLEVGAPIEIEYARNEPHISRARGGRIALVPPLHWIFMWGLLAPGAALALTWVFAVLRLRRLLSRGDVSVAEIRTVEGLRYVLPTMYRVSYVFRDHRAQQRTASHWVRARSPLGERVARAPRQMAVVHNRRGEGSSRLVM
ncbi:MAG: hypothetical protein KDC87_22190, partial [Planctomycetes bacterium]|nr:hypothetical protein [Planctomycetota bacterium]